MLAQFQSLYPNGSLTSELVQIWSGKYIVRASVQIEGVIRATGMAAAETVEAAEDQARNRALMVLGMTSSLSESTVSPKSIPQVQNNPHPALNTTVSVVNSVEQTEEKPEEQTPPPVNVPTTQPEVTSLSDTYNQDYEPRFAMTSNREPEFDIPMQNWAMLDDSSEPEENPLPTPAASNVRQFAPRSYTTEDVGSPKAIGKKSNKSERVDHSDTITKIDIEMQRLGWTTDKGREHLKQTYNKRARSLLDPEELLDFLRYLELQPDPIAGF
ncbi:hypothetical protein PI95_026450 [Hassallia byssoidea VB512170]|uniref:Uncharacterized protein n=1 Tax=Hassallia byssoidea VB512170 TaxID=1304833 RepID=A0A846HEL0_9CYAN|nr:hypothetical protein [Hassalia byssoidea]NEU75997.1 hypothetical protein [Hassalia byssoidea VB512170]